MTESGPVLKRLPEVDFFNDKEGKPEAIINSAYGIEGELEKIVPGYSFLILMVTNMESPEEIPERALSTRFTNP